MTNEQKKAMSLSMKRYHKERKGGDTKEVALGLLKTAIKLLSRKP